MFKQANERIEWGSLPLSLSVWHTHTAVVKDVQFDNQPKKKTVWLLPIGLVGVLLCQLNFYEIEIIDRIFGVCGEYCCVLYVGARQRRKKSIWCYWNTLQIERHTEHLNEFGLGSMFFPLVASLTYSLHHIVCCCWLSVRFFTEQQQQRNKQQKHTHDTKSSPWTAAKAYGCTQMSPLHRQNGWWHR